MTTKNEEIKKTEHILDKKEKPNEEEGRTLGEILENRRKYTTELSSICRQLGFGAVAICWLFKPKIALDEIILPPILLIALIFSILFFICDILQYSSGAKEYGKVSKECQKKIGGEYLNKRCIIPSGTNDRLYQYFNLKIIFLLLSYGTLFIYYIGHLTSRC